MVTKEYNREYYHNVRKHKAQNNDFKFYCECCNCELFFSNKYRHYKTKKHQKNLILFNFTNETEKEIFKQQQEKIKKLEQKLKNL